uniref:Vesicle tethering protein Uso1/P115-like head domain-containing protein n=1 Tax=Arcella intermedia TaxID=1963864 RepID=A0A6B2KY68_9EUKA
MKTNNVNVLTLLETIKHGAKEERTKAISELNRITADPKNITEIGKNLDPLMEILKVDKLDSDEIVEILISIMETPPQKDAAPYVANIENFLKEKENIEIVLSLLEQNDKMKYLSLKLITVLLKKKLVQVQEILLNSMAINNIVDLLKSSDMIVSESLSLLKELSENNQEIQKIIMFAGAFEKLFDIMKENQMGNGGVFVEESLNVLNNLLKNNSINTNIFRESNFIPKFAPLLELDETDLFMLPDQKSKIIELALETVQILCSCNNPQDTYACQSALSKCGVLDLVLKLALGGVYCSKIRSSALWSLGFMIKGHAENCAKFRDAQFTSVKSQKPQHSVLRILNITFTSQVYKERRASLHCLQCYLLGNEDAQLALASTITPPPVDPTSNEEETIGRTLLRTLMGWEHDTDNLRPWYASMMLSYILQDNRPCKERLLRLQLEIPKAESSGLPSDNLFTKIIKEVGKAIKIGADVQIQVGILRLLSVWIYDCPQAIQAFLQSTSQTQIFLDLMTQGSSNIHVVGLGAIILGSCLLRENDIDEGILMALRKNDKFVDAIKQITKSEDFVFAEQRKYHMNTEDSNKLMFYDYQYTLFFNRAQQQIMKVIQGIPKKPVFYPLTSTNSSPQLVESPQLQQQLREKDNLLMELQAKISGLEKEILNTNSLMELQKAQNAELTEQNTTLKQAKKTLKQRITLLTQKNLSLEQKYLSLEDQLKHNDLTYNQNMSALHSRIIDLQKALDEKNANYQELEANTEELYIVLAEKSLEIRDYKKQLGLPVDDEEN